MKNKIKNEKLLVPRALYNQFLTFLRDKDFIGLVNEQRKALEVVPVGVVSKSEFMTACRKAIRSYVRDKNLPESWVDPIYTFITTDQPDVPLNGGITLKVDGQEITGKGELLLIQDKNGRLAGENTISIVISAKVSIDRIVNFIKTHKRNIENLQKQINLPEYDPLNWKDLDLGLKIIRLRDEKKLTFSAIADELEKQENVSAEDLKEMPDEAVVKTLYHRYKKRLSRA